MEITYPPFLRKLWKKFFPNSKRESQSNEQDNHIAPDCPNTREDYIARGFIGISNKWYMGEDASWSNQEIWEEHYLYQSKKERERQYLASSGGAEELLNELIRLGWLPKLPQWRPCRIMDAGCGLSLCPHILKEWGCDVTAIDLSPTAIEKTKNRNPKVSEIVENLFITEPIDNAIFAAKGEHVEELLSRKRQKQIFEYYRCEGGKAQFLSGDWLQAEFEKPFDIIFCHNSLRLATQENWRLSLKFFMRHLSQGGVLIIRNVQYYDSVKPFVLKDALKLGYCVLEHTGGRFVVQEGKRSRILQGGIGYEATYREPLLEEVFSRNRFILM